MSRYCAIVSGGEFSPLSMIGQCEFIIACDRGYEYCVRQNLRPDLVLGDFDSCLLPVAENIRTIRLPKQKDDTDTMYAMRQAVELGFTDVYMYCALGGRLDHLFANLQCALYGASHGAQVMIIGEKETIICSGAGHLVLPRKEGFSLSVFAADHLDEVTIKGALYDTDRAELTNTFPLGQSNGWNADEVVIDKSAGIIIIIESAIA